MGAEGRQKVVPKEIVAVLIVVILAVAGLAALVPLGMGSHATGQTTRLSPDGRSRSPSVPIAVDYKSSVDSYPLSYLVWFPTGYVAGDTYPLAIFLHGIGTTTWVRGGTGGITDLSGTNIPASAQAAGLIFVSLNTRSAAGFYTNTPNGGPQEQDVLDAVASIEANYHVSKIYLIGFSMGSMGAFALAYDDPGMFSGIATVGTITDAYEAYAWTATTARMPQWAWDMGLPANVKTTNATLDGLFAHLSRFRFNESSFVGMPVYVVAGAKDPRAINNFALWPFAEGNSTMTNSTCAVTSFEPANCTTPFWTMNGTFRFVWEAQGTHTSADLPATDVFSFLLGKEGSGFFTTTAPPTTLRQVYP